MAPRPLLSLPSSLLFLSLPSSLPPISQRHLQTQEEFKGVLIHGTVKVVASSGKWLSLGILLFSSKIIFLHKNCA